MSVKICKNCGKKFESENSVVFCSDECWLDFNENKNERKVKCQFCGKEFKTPIRKYGTYHIRKFCSNDCSRNFYREQNKTKIVKCLVCNSDIILQRNPKTNRFPKLTEQVCENCKENYTKNMYHKRICRNCGIEFTVNYNYNSAFCSKDCYNEYNKKENYTNVIPQGVCVYCGKTFNLPQDKNGRYNKEKKYCSVICETLQYYKENPMPKRFCQICGKELIFTPGKDDPSNYKKLKYCDNPECRQKGQTENLKKTCLEKYGVSYPCFRNQTVNSNCAKISKINVNFAQSLENMGFNVGLDTITLDDFSYDIHIKNTNILIEINPTYTHNVLGNHYNGWQYDKKFETLSLLKTELAKKNGYRCINIWDWDDVDKVLLLLKPKQKLYARKLQLKEATKQEANILLKNHHLQSSCYGNQVNFGLYQNDQLVQIMTFGKPRYNKKYQYELLRLCSHSDYLIVGGAEKLFKYFVDNYQPESIISYCDVSKFTGDVYERLGFKLKEQTKPAKIWSKRTQHITDNLLRQRGFDQLIGSKMNPPQLYGKGTNNEELMIKYDWLPIYDCGQKVFEWYSN